jgi:AcrR family transcriptional regulator
MITKAERTKEFIIQKVAPIFNKNGYAATSMKEITKATNLTKGAIYGNFKDKEDLALASFDYNMNFILGKIKNMITTIDSPLAKLYAITNFYREYYKHNINFGGCPVLNVGIDANYNNPKLFNRVEKVILKLQNSIAQIIKDGQELNEIKKDVDATAYGSRIYAMIEGAVFSSVMLKNDKYLLDMMNYLDQIIKTELQNITK